MFVRGGLVFPGGDLNSAGNGGLYWSSVSYNSDYAHLLNFYPNGVYPSDGYYRYNGFSVRCVALGG